MNKTTKTNHAFLFEKSIFFMLILIITTSNAFGQQYGQSGGVRLGHTSGFTYKKFVKVEQAVEMMLSGREKGIQFTALYEYHKPLELSFNESFFFTYGLGAHIGYQRYSGLKKNVLGTNPFTFEYEDQSYVVIGADAMIGVEYRWLSLPMTITFDVKPYFNYIGMRYLDAQFWDAAVSFKYIF
jgi:hypothetical protein